MTVVAFMAFAAFTALTLACPSDDWVEGEKSGKCYLAINATMSYLDAAANCTAGMAKLAEPKSQDEIDDLIEIFDFPFWVGINQLGRENDTDPWRYASDNGTLGDFKPWGDREPYSWEIEGPEGYSCVFTSATGKWHVDQCYHFKADGACEEASSSSTK